ncbi:hypothetical protein ACQP00_19420 [Dactylosporangium sp. CS-047395]|uniref:hypothetical protein n=1 Tax=Dactylosporangium sp. CS-047395 TaxID=3239936 RepID=UPI003D94F4DA
MLNAHLGATAKRILRYAPLWGEHGPMLLSALHSVVRLHRAGEHGDLGIPIRIICYRRLAT